MKFGNILSFLLIAFLSIANFSCGDDAEEENKAKLIGAWIASERIIQCEGADDVMQEIACSEQSCIEFLFEVDEEGRQIYIKNYISSGITESEFGNFSVGESSVSFCQQNDGEEICSSSGLKVSNTELELSSTNDDGCREILIFFKES